MPERSPSFGRVSAEVAGSMPAPSVGAADARQRHALSYLAWFEYPVELRTLATYVAAGERNVPVDTVSDELRDGVAVALHHVDLPKLVAADVVRYDPESRMVVCTDATNGMGRYADVTDSRSSDAA